MTQVKPFRAHRPPRELAREVASFPYDVIDSDEARALSRGNPYSFLHVGKPEIDLDPSVSPYDERVYAKGAENLRRFIQDGILLRDPVPCFYVYQQKMGTHVQAGIVGACGVREYETGLIKKHEQTRKHKEDDRTRHMTVCNANPEPVFLAYRARPGIDALVNTVRSGPPAVDFVASDGIGHTLWVIPGGEPPGAEPPASGARIGSAKNPGPSDAEKGGGRVRELTRLFAEIPCLYVADGHHRTAAALRLAQVMRGQKPSPRGDEPYEFFMAVLFPHDQVRILDYNRLVRDLNGLTSEEFLAKVCERFLVFPAGPSPDASIAAQHGSVRAADHERAPVHAADNRHAKPATPHTFGMFLEGRWYRLEAKPGTYSAADPIGGLDISILQENLLAPVLGVGDQRTDKRIDFVGGIRGLAELEKRCHKGWAVAFALYPTSLDQLMAVADAGLFMPPKSTWFEPKLRSGLFVRLLDE